MGTASREAADSTAARRDGISGVIIVTDGARTTGWETCTIGALKAWAAMQSASMIESWVGDREEIKIFRSGGAPAFSV